VYLLSLFCYLIVCLVSQGILNVDSHRGSYCKNLVNKNWGWGIGLGEVGS